MKHKNMPRVATLLAVILVSGLTGTTSAATNIKTKDYSHSTFYADGKIDYGKISDSYSSDLSMYIDVNQFMVMKDLIDAFQKHNPGIKKIFVETTQSDRIIDEQLLMQNKIAGKKLSMTPDLYASDNVDYLNALYKKSMMNKYMIYAHNQLALEVKKGNPKHIKSPMDFARKNVVVVLPNPLTEDIFKSYGSKMLKMLDIYDDVTDNTKCINCWAIKGKTLFTTNYHTQTMHLLRIGKADVGLDWGTEILYLQRAGRKVEGVAIPSPYNMVDKTAYAIGALNNAKHPKNARLFLAFLSTQEAQDIYARYGFIKATPAELKLKSLPGKL